MKTRFDGHTPGPWKPYYFRSPRGARAYWGVGNNAALLQVAHWVNDKSTADLIAASPDLLEDDVKNYEMLKKLEWWRGDPHHQCPVCYHFEGQGHENGCSLAAKLLATEKLLGIVEG